LKNIDIDFPIKNIDIANQYIGDIFMVDFIKMNIFEINSISKLKFLYYVR
jgi:hypothetical protein